MPAVTIAGSGLAKSAITSIAPAGPDRARHVALLLEVAPPLHPPRRSAGRPASCLVLAHCLELRDQELLDHAGELRHRLGLEQVAQRQLDAERLAGAQHDLGT